MSIDKQQAMQNWDQWLRWKKLTDKIFPTPRIISHNIDKGFEMKIDSVNSVSESINFYKKGKLFKGEDKIDGNSIKVLIKDNEEWFFLDNTNEPIYEFNKIAILNVSLPSTAFAYVRFFFSEVSGRHGKFYIVENLEEVKVALKLSDNIDWEIGENKTEDLREYLPTDSIKTFIYDIKNKEIFFEKIFMIFKDSLFSAKVIIKTDEDNLGELQLIDEVLLVEISSTV